MENHILFLPLIEELATVTQMTQLLTRNILQSTAKNINDSIGNSKRGKI